MIEFTYLPAGKWMVGAGLVVAAILFASYYLAVGKAVWSLRGLLIGLRWIAIAGVVICLLDPQRVEEVQHKQKAEVAVLLDASRSMGVQDIPGGRLGAAKSWIANSLLPAWHGNAAPAFYAFHDTAQVVGDTASVQPGGAKTGVGDALDTLLAQSKDRALAGVILCSDGIDHSGRDLTNAARAFRRKGIPIHTASFGTTAETHDIMIDNVQVKRAIPNESPTRIAVSLRAPGFENRTVPVQIQQGRDVLGVQEVKLTRGPQRVELEFTPKGRGFQTYQVSIPVQTGEWLQSNNARNFGVEVNDPTIRVIYMEGTPQQSSAPIPEWKYLKDALEADRNIKVKVLYQLQSSSSGEFRNTVDADPDTGEKIYPVHHATKGFPKTMADLLKYDVVIHSDIKVQFFSPQQLQNMADLVEKHGGGFIMVGGNSAFGRGGYQKTVIDRITPVAMQQYADTLKLSFQMDVPASALSHPVMAIGATLDDTRRIWTEKFPRFYGFNRVDRAKPGAVVLGETPRVNGSSSGSAGRVVIAVQDIGKGRSMAFTSDTTRTWGRDFETLWGERINLSYPLTESNCDARYYRAFWVNAIRWLAAGKAGKTNNAVTLELAQGYAELGQGVTASVKVRDAELNALSGAEVSLSIESGGTNRETVRASFDAGSRSYQAQVRSPDVGAFVVKARAKVKGVSIGEDQQLLTVENSDVEMADVRARPDTLAALSRASGGKQLSQTADLGSIFNAIAPVAVEYKRTPLWDNAWWLAGILGLLSTEWAIRRWRGLA